MNSNKMQLTVDIKLSWWLTYLYIPMLILFAKFCQQINIDAEPNCERIRKVIRKGIKLKNIRTTYDKS